MEKMLKMSHIFKKSYYSVYYQENPFLAYPGALSRTSAQQRNSSDANVDI